MAIRFSDKMKFAKKHLSKSAQACSIKNRSRWNSLFELSSGNMEQWSYSRSDAKSWKKKEVLHRKIAVGVFKI